MDVDPQPNRSTTPPWLGTNGYVSPLASFPPSSVPSRTNSGFIESQAPSPAVSAPNLNAGIRQSTLTKEQYDRRMQRIIQGLKEREEEEAKKPLVIQCFFDDVPGRIPLPVSINDLALEQSKRRTALLNANNNALQGHSPDGEPATNPQDICDHACLICTAPPHPASAIDRFFSQFPDFRYNQRAPARMEFTRLQKFYGRRWSESRHRNISDQFEDVMTEQFNLDYGTDENNLDALQYLCAVLRRHPIPDTVEGCQREIEAVHVNIYDLLDYHRSGLPVPLYDSAEDLRRFLKRSGKFFPLRQAKAGGVLKFLLRRIF